MGFDKGTKKMIQLSPRLKFVSTQLLRESPVWDICCDHGYLGIWALQNYFPEVHFVDPVSSIIEKIQQRALAHQEANAGRIFLHPILGQDIEEEITGTIVILGVGPYVIKAILDSLWQKKKMRAQRIILGPQRNPEKLEGWIEEWQKSKEIFNIQKETLVERKRQRVIFILDLTKT